MSIHKLRALEYLCAVVEHGGFNAAARKLGVAAPSVHRLVKALEAELGVVLLDRAAAPLRPTPDAQPYVDRARRLLAELQGVEASLHDHGAAPQGTVTIAAHSVVLQFVLPELLGRLHQRHPGLRLDLIDAGAQRDLAKLGTDLLLQFGWPPPQEAQLRTLAYSRWLVVASPAYWASRGAPAHPSELVHHPCMLFRTPYGEVLRHWVFERGDERVEVEVNGWLTGDHRAALDAPVFGGQLVARLNDLTARQGLAAGTLQPVMLDWVGASSPPLNLLMRKAVSRQPRVRAVVEFLAEAGAELAQLRLPAGLPAVRPAGRPDWFKRRVGG
jgi:DNA-binding transcriptional LysR family regulator